MVSSLSLHNRYLLFCCVLSILALIWLVLMALFCYARDSVSLLRFPFLSHVYVFSSKMSPVSRLKHPYSCLSSRFCFLVISVLLVLVSIVSVGCNQSSFAFSCIVFESLYRCINAVFNAGKSSFFFFSWYIIRQRHLMHGH